MLPQPILMRCRQCGTETTYPRRLDKSIPDSVVLIETACATCEPPSVVERWFDAEGNEVKHADLVASCKTA